MSGPSTIEIVGGVPLISVIGTPRTIGENIGKRLASRLQVLSQYLLEQLAASAQAGGTPLDPTSLRDHLRSTILPAARLEPSLWMEIESMARAANLPEEDLLLIHGYGDLLSHFGCAAPPTRSTMVSLASPHTDHGLSRMVYAWHLDPALFPYITLVRRIPSHGPANLTLTLCGLHPVAGLSEAGIAAATNELRVTDGAAEGHFTSHLLASALTAPAFDDAAQRIRSGPRQGGATVHLLTQSDRASCELSGREATVLPDPFVSAPRVHTNHPLDESMMRWAAEIRDPSSRLRLVGVAQRAIDARGLAPNALANWFGLGVRDDASDSIRLQAAEGINPETTVLALMDPSTRTLHLKRGGNPSKLEAITL